MADMRTNRPLSQVLLAYFNSFEATVRSLFFDMAKKHNKNQNESSIYPLFAQTVHM